MVRPGFLASKIAWLVITAVLFVEMCVVNYRVGLRSDVTYFGAFAWHRLGNLSIATTLLAGIWTLHLLTRKPRS